MKPLELGRHCVAGDIGVPSRRINEIVHGKQAVVADTALRLSRYFGTTAQFRLNLGTRHDLEKETDRSIRRIEREVHVLPARKRQAP